MTLAPGILQSCRPTDDQGTVNRSEIPPIERLRMVLKKEDAVLGQDVAALPIR